MNRDMLKKQAKAFCPSWLKKKSCSWSIWIQLESISPCVINPSVYPCASAVHTPPQADASQALLLSAFAVDAPGSPRTRLAQQLHLFPLPSRLSRSSGRAVDNKPTVITTNGRIKHRQRLSKRMVGGCLLQSALHFLE